jgi:Domain of unknown function (DUF4329)
MTDPSISPPTCTSVEHGTARTLAALAFSLAAFSVPVAAQEAATLTISSAEIALVRSHLGRAQKQSFRSNREYCGYLGRTSSGRLVVTRLVPGYRDVCTPPLPQRGVTRVASIHTHGAYDRDVPAEFPTTLDIESDATEGVNGYIATPGGRLWYVDSRARVVHQLCGPGCLPQDPDFHPGDDGDIRELYRYRDLLALENPR